MQVAARGGALAFVVLWLLSSSLQALVPFWLPFAILAAMELELLVGGIRERRHGAPLGLPSAACRGRTTPTSAGWRRSTRKASPCSFPRRRARRGVRSCRSCSWSQSGRCSSRTPTASTATRDGRRYPRPTRAKAERRFTAEAARIAGRPVRVVCDESYAFTGVGSDAAGVAFIPRGLAYLEPSVCRSLYRVAFERKLGARDDAAFAITVLAHEAVHLRGCATRPRRSARHSRWASGSASGSGSTPTRPAP